MSADAVLRYRSFSVTFPVAGGEVEAVRSLDLDLHAGEVLAVVGESGSGKTVTSLAALGLLPSTARVAGSVSLDGRDVLTMTRRELEQVRGAQVAMVFQEPMTALNPLMKVGDQIAEVVLNHGRADRAQAARQALALLVDVGIPEPERRLTQYPHELSGGQRQRVMIAMALACDPAVIVADEPTTALDVTVQAEILQLLRELRDRRGVAILLITHNMGVVADLADRAAVMYRGELVEVGTAEQVLTAPRHDYTRALLAAVPKLPELRLGGAEVHANGTRADGAAGRRPESVPEDTRARSADGPGPTTSGPAPADAGPAPAPALGGAVLDLDRVAIDYRIRGAGRFRAVDGVSLRIGPGDFVGLVGESGSGKSTIGRAALGLLRPSEGTVRLFGTDPTRGRGRARRAARRRLGVVLQDPGASLDPRMSVGDCVAEPMVVHLSHDSRGRAARVAQLLDSVHLSADMAARHPHELSGGQRQRVSLARALALDPELLIADEPTSALDVSVQASVLGVLAELQERYSFACLFISHDLAVVDSLTARVAVMQGGSIVEAGPTDQVLRSPRTTYARRLLTAAPVPDPREQRARRESWTAVREAHPA